MFEAVTSALAALWRDARALFRVDSSVIEFEAMEWTVGIAAALIALAALKYLFAYLWRKNSSHRRHSSVHDLKKRPKGFLARFLYAIPRLVFVFGAVSLLAALGKPYISMGYQEREVASREICYMVDASGSMTSEFGSSKKTISEIANSALYAFIKMRAKYNDRSCYWIFSNNPHLYADFTTDFNVFLFQVYLAPWAFNPPNSNLNNPPGKFPSVNGEGGTDFRRGLSAATTHFVDQGVSDTVMKALIIVSDAEANELPSAEFEEMRRNHIIPFLIFIRSPVAPSYGYYGRGGPPGAGTPSSGPSAIVTGMLEAIKTGGGAVYEVRNTVGNEAELTRALRDINRRIQFSRVPQILFQEKRRIHGLFLAAGTLAVLVAILLGLLVEKSFGTRP